MKMMFKKILTFCFAIVTLSSCLNNNEPSYTFEFLPIDEAIVPASFKFGERDTIAIKYTLNNGCYSFDNLYYEYQDTVRVVAVRALLSLENACTLNIRQEEYKFVVNVTQKEDYLFKFWKGKDSNGEDTFEEIVVPVN
ncbi:hypothetical protein BTO16_13330 [Polaribacter glomeratus]|uniref:Lipoprotein n=2 Tax=Polaribacter glomeratus TaxID=102 RepID=A0A2S7WGW1_9FLAO|nr:hypothetical protein BTO16_13330 [Polaribacter glomeratus]TXD67309.1 hypothetical protein ESX12_01585 [Polaribacter glomeratus]